MWVVFFFQAEDGIRDIGVTGVQTCALPIFDDGALDLDDGADALAPLLLAVLLALALRPGGLAVADLAPLPSEGRAVERLSAVALGHESSSSSRRTGLRRPDRKSTRLNSSHANISYAVFCLKKKN